MNILSILAGGVGSGCKGPNCGRKIYHVKIDGDKYEAWGDEHDIRP